MSDIYTRNDPVYYEPTRIALQQNEGTGNIVATADFNLRNADGLIIDTDHPSVVLTPAEQSTFLAWFLDKLADYEAVYPNLTRWTGAPT